MDDVQNVPQVSEHDQDIEVTYKWLSIANWRDAVHTDKVSVASRVDSLTFEGLHPLT
jgi:hypothetical protein